MFSKDTVESKLELSVFSLNRHGMLTSGYGGSLRWSNRKTGEQKASVGVKCEGNRLRLNYKTRRYGGDWEIIEEIIHLSKTTPNYGGSRFWLLCPGCQSRRAKLYSGNRFRCRKCLDLCYETQLENGLSRMLTAMYKIRCRLGDYDSLDEGFPEKPKGMRWRTYNELHERYSALEGSLTVFE